MFSQAWRKTQPVCAKRLRVAELREYLSDPEPDVLLCSNQCRHLIEAMQKVATWLAQWEKKTLSPPFVQDMLTLATHGVRLLEELKQADPWTWLGIAAFKLESREEFLELFERFLQGLKGYVEVMQGPLSHLSTHNTPPPSPSFLSSSRSAGSYETCMNEVTSLISNLEDPDFLEFLVLEDRRALFQSLEQGSFAKGEDSRIARWLMERLEDKEKHNHPFLLDSPDIMHGPLPRLGEGSFGKVFEATWMRRTVAVKEIEFQKIFEDELKALHTTSHVNVMRALAYRPQDEFAQSYLVVMERMKGDLGQFVSNLEAAKNDLPLPVLVDILLQVATGMAHLHEKNLVHRDLKPENILFDRWPPMSAQQLQEGPADFTAKIADFGGARTETYDTTVATANCGTGFYRAPEVRHAINTDGDKARYSNKVDVFSFAMVCYKLLTKSDPKFSPEKAAGGDFSELKFPSGCPRALVYLVKRCYAIPHRKRPSFVEIRDFLALFKSIVLSTKPAIDKMPLLYLGIGDDVLAKLVAFLGIDWLTEEAISLEIGVEFVESTNRRTIDETWLRLQVTKKLADFRRADLSSRLHRIIRGVSN